MGWPSAWASPVGRRPRTQLLRNGRGCVIDRFLELPDGFAEDSNRYTFLLLSVDLVLADGKILMTVLRFLEIDEVRRPP